MGVGKYNSRDYKSCYYLWNNMLKRCYDKDNRSYISYGAQGIFICEEWKCFQNFAAWYEEHYIKDYQLDKDILCNIQHLEQKIYSPETCLFIPSEVNGFFSW